MGLGSKGINFSITPELEAEIEAHWRAQGFLNRSEWFRELYAANLFYRLGPHIDPVSNKRVLRIRGEVGGDTPKKGLVGKSGK
jgi:hypothetical protein